MTSNAKDEGTLAWLEFACNQHFFFYQTYFQPQKNLTNGSVSIQVILFILINNSQQLI